MIEIKKNKFKEIFFISILYFIFFLIGVLSYKDYGISVDEIELRLHGFVNLKYIMQIINYEDIKALDLILFIPNFIDFSAGYTHGVIFVLPMAFVEFFFNITDSQDYYFLRHYFNHLIFLISTFYFYLLAKERFNNWIYGLFGALFLFLSPRIFAESFYNHKDLLFLSLFIINLYYGIHFLRKPNIKTSIFFAISTALSIDIRIMGIIIFPIIIFFVILRGLRDKKYNLFFPLLLYIITFPLLTILFWPYLWENPLLNFVNVFQTLGSFGWEGYNFYLGSYHKASNLPWHYSIVWIFLTIPTLYVFLFFCGLLTYLSRFLKRILKIEENNLNDFWKSQIELEDLIYHLLFFSPIVLIILLNSTLYNGWRHLYFIYPCLLMISLRGYYIININFFKKKIWISNIVIILFLAQTGFVMFKEHPHQNVYFNIIGGKNIYKKFELDYWGLSNKQALEYILKEDKSDFIRIGSAGPISINNSKQILRNKDKKRILVSKNFEADYIINNFINWSGAIKKKRYEIPKNFVLYKEITVGKKTILSIFKRKL